VIADLRRKWPANNPIGNSHIEMNVTLSA
jgi:hypothetical protein